MHHSIHSSTIYNNQDMEATQVSINRGIDQDVVCVYIFTHSGILQSHKTKEILPFATIWMESESIMLSEASQRNTNTV